MLKMEVCGLWVFSSIFSFQLMLSVNAFLVCWCGNWKILKTPAVYAFVSSLGIDAKSVHFNFVSETP